MSKKKPFSGYDADKNARTGGLNARFRERYNRENNANLKAPVTGKVKAGSKDAKRRKSFCARMSGAPGKLWEYKDTNRDGKKEKVKTAKKAALDRWRCKNAG